MTLENFKPICCRMPWRVRVDLGSTFKSEQTDLISTSHKRQKIAHSHSIVEIYAVMSPRSNKGISEVEKRQRRTRPAPLRRLRTSDKHVKRRKFELDMCKWTVGASERYFMDKRMYWRSEEGTKSVAPKKSPARQTPNMEGEQTEPLTGATGINLPTSVPPAPKSSTHLFLHFDHHHLFLEPILDRMGLLGKRFLRGSATW